MTMRKTWLESAIVIVLVSVFAGLLARDVRARQAQAPTIILTPDK